jgi:hypothetical protein
LRLFLRRANDTSYGLGASVWGSDVVQLRTVAARLEAGPIWVNRHAVPNPFAPMSAHKIQAWSGVRPGRLGSVLQYSGDRGVVRSIAAYTVFVVVIVLLALFSSCFALAIGSLAERSTEPKGIHPRATRQDRGDHAGRQ